MVLVWQFEPRLVIVEAAHPVALRQQEFAAAQAQVRIVGPRGQRHVEIGERTGPIAARGQQTGARTERRHQAMVDRQGLVVGALGLVGPAKRFEGAAPVMGDHGIAGAKPGCPLQRHKGFGMCAQDAEAAREIDLCGRIPGQKSGRALQRLARLGESSQLQPCLAQQVQRLARVGPGVDHLREQRLGCAKIAGGGAPDRVAGKGIDLLVGERHDQRLADDRGKEKAGDRQGG